MRISGKIIVVVFFCGLIQSVSAKSVADILKQYYPKYHQQNQCYIGKSLQYYEKDKPVYGDYCLKIDAQKTVDTVQGKMRYILLTGSAIDLENNSFNGAHMDSGAVGMLVLKSLDGYDWQPVAAKTGIAVGAYGEAPSGWTLHQFGSDIWGFLNHEADMHQGYGGSRYVILLPVGKTIHDSRITANVDNEGALGDCSQEMGFENTQDRDNCLRRLQTLTSTIKINREGEMIDGMYPLKLTVNGFSGKKKYRDYSVAIPFDAKRKRYLEPKSSPMAGADF